MGLEARAVDGRARDAERALYMATRALSAELGDAAWAAHRVGDDVLREVIDATFDVADLSVANVLTRFGYWTGQAQETGAVLGSRLDLLWAQARNNFEVYNLVKNVRSRLKLDWDRPFDLGALVQAAYGLGAYADLWAIEGLGHDYATMCLDRQHGPSGILRDGPASTLPASSLTMMHAGLGLALAERTVTPLTPFSGRADFRRAVTSFANACEAHSREGFVGAAYESLGLVVRTWHPQLMERMDGALLELDPGLAGFFWHGAGRALYFLPASIVPGLWSPWRGADREAPHELAHRNLYAGLAWATTLVNIRRPPIMAHLLEIRGDALARSDGFANGIASAIVVGIDITPGDPHILGFAAYDAAGAQPRAQDLWNTIVRPAAIAAVERYHPLLSSQHRLELVFRYNNLESLVLGRDRGDAVLSLSSATRRAPRGPQTLGTGGEQPGSYPASGAPARHDGGGR